LILVYVLDGVSGLGLRVLVEIDAAVGKLAEGSLLLDLGGLLGVL
jgi:hypothetical protein